MNNTTGRRIGLIGGLGVGAAVHYYRELARAHEARGAAMNFLMIQADMPRVVEHVRHGRTGELAHYFAGLIESLKAGGAELAAVPAVTPHVCFAELEAVSPLPLVNILATTAAEVMARNYRRVAVFGTRYTVESDMFACLRGVTVVRPDAAEIEVIHDIYFRLASTGQGTDDDHRRLTDLALRLVRRDQVDAIVMAGTDLAVLFDRDNTSFPHLDCARVHVDEIMRLLFL